MNRLITTLLTIAALIGLSACGGDDTQQSNDSPATSEAPIEDTVLSHEETLARLLELAKAGDWETYVDDFYGESHKFEGIPERREAVIARFRDKWVARTL